MINDPEHALKKAEEINQLYQDIIYSSRSMIAVFKGKDMIIDLANNAIVETWAKGKDVIGKSLFTILPEIVEQGYVEILAKVYKTGETYHAYEIPINLKRNGKLEKLYYTFTYQAQRGANGDIEGVVIIANEVSPQALIKKQIQESEAHFRMIAEMMPEKITNATPDGTVFFYNKSWQDYTGVSLEQLVKNGWANWIHPDDLAKTEINWNKSLKSGVDFNIELRMMNHLGEYRWHNSKARAVKDENQKIKLWIGFNADINDQKKVEKDLEVAKSELLFQKVEKGKRADELGIANIELAFQNEEKEKRADELGIANIELAFQKVEKGKRADELGIANIELAFQNEEKEKREAEFLIANYSRSLIEASHDPMIVISPKGKITDVNQATINATGIIRQKLLDTNFYDYFTEPKKAKEVYKEVFLKGYVSDYPLTIKDHVLTPVLFNGSVYKGEKGKVLGAVVVARDITEQKKNDIILQQTLKELSDYKYALDASSIVEVTDNNGVMKYVNENFCKISQYSSEELIGKSHRIINSAYHSKELMRNLWTTISGGKIWRDEIKNKAKDGSFYWVLTTIIPFIDFTGKPYQYVAIRTDITEQKRIENELLEAKEQAELATSYAEIAQSKAEDAVKSKQQFLSNMSHEIRTPMNAIIGFTKVLLKTDLTAKQKEYLTAIKLSGDALIVLINDILDLAKVDAGKMSFENIPFKLASSIGSMLHLFETKIQEKNLKLIREYDQRVPEILMGDPVRLHQIIVNLVSNAVKFTSTGSITVSVLQLDEDEEKVTIQFSVTDTGIGIPEDKKESIFDNFQQASSNTSRIFGGTGLGLSIVKQLVEPQGGTIQVESEINEGSRFSFILSFLKTNDIDISLNDIIELDVEIKDIKVLVVEDMALNQLLIRTLLDDFGFSSDITANGKLAIEKLATKKYDIILMDLQMPEMNGFEATKHIRNILKSDIPIIALTADVTTVDLAKCKEVGMNDYIAKPVDERLLYSKIVGLVKKSIPEKSVSLSKIKYTDLSYLIQRTKSDPALMMEIISLYLEQIPPLISTMKQSLKEKDWATLGNAVHKMIPSFSIVGIKPDFEKMAKKIQEYAVSQQLNDEIHDLVSQLENACALACEELKEELIKISQLR
jgi:PAS domain S-box-containing protein